MKKDWAYKEYIPMEENIERPSYEHELEFYESVKNGNVEALRKGLKINPFSTNNNWGILSENSHRNLIYHFIITTALLARVCMEGGMNVDEAYMISDYYIQKIDKTKTEKEIDKLHQDMVIDYTSRMIASRKNKIYSKQISRCIDYIYDHLTENITTSDIASKIGLSRAYLSTLFKKETNFTINEFITLKKLQTAENMLKYSHYNISEISNLLAFSSQSYFTKLFKTYSGETPKRFANKNTALLTKMP